MRVYRIENKDGIGPFLPKNLSEDLLHRLEQQQRDKAEGWDYAVNKNGEFKSGVHICGFTSIDKAISYMTRYGYAEFFEAIEDMNVRGFMLCEYDLDSESLFTDNCQAWFERKSLSLVNRLELNVLFETEEKLAA